MNNLNNYKKTLLIISGGIESVPGIKIAKEMGLKVVVSDGSKNAPGFQFADYQLLASTYDKEDTLEKVLYFNKNITKIDGVICIASDVPLTVAYVANNLKLPSISIEAAKLASDKLAMKERFYKDGLPIPWFKKINSLKEIQEIILQEGFPLVLKPVDSRGSRGVIRINSDNINLKEAYEEALGYSPTNRVMIEKFLEGPQISTESLVLNEKVFTPGFADRNYEFLDKFSPNIIENGGNLPSLISQDLQEKVKNLLIRAAKSIGVKNGIIKGDIVVHNKIPYIIELATRLSGGYFCSHEIPANTGIEFVKLAIKQCLGEFIDRNELAIKKITPVAQRYWFPNEGEVKEIIGIDKYKNNENVILLEIRVKEGDRIQKINSHPGRAGVVITKGKSVNEAVLLAEEIVNNIIIKIK